jgi:C-terminal processing protease CtpA/Prc
MESLRSPHRSADKFAGRVFLLISHATDSAGVVTAAVFKYNKMGVTIGQETAGRIRFCSDPVLVRLPRTGLRMYIPLAIYALPGAMPDRGVVPDIEVPHTIESLRNDEDPEIVELRKILAK